MARSFRFKASSLPLQEGASESIIDLARVGAHDNRFTWTPEKFQELVKNFKANAYRLSLPSGDPVLQVNYGHNQEEAAGWITDVFTEMEDDGVHLKAKVRWTPRGAQSVRDMEYLYASAEWFSDYVDPETQKKWGLVLAGAGLVIDPAVKDLEVLTAKKQIKKGVTKMAKFEQAAVADMTLEDVLSWISSAAPEDKMKIVEAAGGVPAPSDDVAPMDTPPGTSEKAQDMPKEKAASENEKIKSLEGAVSALQSKLNTAQRNSEFDSLFMAGKVVEAQRQAFVNNDITGFIAASVELNTVPHGTKSVRMEASQNLTAEEQHVLKSFKGAITKEMLLKARKENK